MTGTLKERDTSLNGSELCVEQRKKELGTANDDWAGSVAEVNGFTTGQPKMVKLLPGERMAHVRGAVNDVRTPIRLDTGANVSIITTKLARRLKLKRAQRHGRQLEVQGIKKGSMNTTTRVIAKVTLGWNTVYEYEFWVIEHCAGSDVVLGTDFMIPAGIRLDLFNANVNCPEK
ncbi:Eukaryotic/viral aspartic protease [Phytophthora megakarya]|uniref:Eukaryotic/viral aspartic protease n=1 Tax=Phytophthora megakarya TaxID=4795 RepID=A0A225VNT7_9STRA|nr:Eukaryotic/viral aspartic protease [Phytophthora megakarya]